MMAGVIKTVFQRGLGSLYRSPFTTSGCCCNASPIPLVTTYSGLLTRACSSYYSSQNFGQSQKPYMKKKKVHYGYENALFDGGVLPRPEGKYEDKPLPMPKYKPGNNWSSRKALFGQNDYIDLLGDGSVQPWQTIKAPSWLKAYKGNELQRLSRKLSMRGAYMKEFYPTQYAETLKRIWFLYKRLNRRRQTPFWGTRNARATSRIDRIRDF